MWPYNKNVVHLFNLKLSPLIKELNLSRCGNKSYDFCKKGGKYCMSIDHFGKTNIYYNDLVDRWVQRAPSKSIPNSNEKIKVTIEDLESIYKNSRNNYFKLYNTITQAENELFIPYGTIQKYLTDTSNGPCILSIFEDNSLQNSLIVKQVFMLID